MLDDTQLGNNLDGRIRGFIEELSWNLSRGIKEIHRNPQ
jgi:hypothetical protein